ncbi:hypothetical protein L9F63_026136 [Diploptera punctata]|uniref:Short-chain dehydrogenase n=1 Tax=Diploptera punctata TaxID=6984 RepID=A0AAD8AKB9_DIPPU|nr:hypothetical protein L9F63_026136 [Diploptera punctata]
MITKQHCVKFLIPSAKFYRTPTTRLSILHQNNTTSNSGEGNNVFLKIYSLMILVLDILSLLVKVLLAVLESIYYNIAGVQEKSVSGEIVLITGTGHGIGKELARQYAELGAILVCWDINTELNEQTVQELRKMGAKAYGYKCDVSDREAVLELAKKVKAEVGGVYRPD